MKTVTESEGERQSAINVAEGNKQAAILEAEGARESSILRAEGSRHAQILEAEGFSIGLQRIYETAQRVDSNTMGLQHLEMMKQLGAGQSIKWIIRMDLASIAGNLSATLGGIAGGAGANGGRSRAGCGRRKLAISDPPTACRGSAPTPYLGAGTR